MAVVKRGRGVALIDRKDRMAEVVSLGESMLLLIPARSGRLEDVESYAVAVGGAESNVAVNLARLGVPSRWASRVGDDGFGRYLLREIAATGVDVSAVEVDPALPTGIYFKEILNGTTRVHYYRAGSAASAMSVDWLGRTDLSGQQFLHLTGITPALSDDCRELVWRLLAAPPAGARVSFDVNWRPRLWRDHDPEILRQLAGMAGLLLVGDDEAREMWGVAEPAAIRRLLPEPRVLVVKHGERGATMFHEDDEFFEHALQVDVLEPVGAGDAFAAGILAGMVEGLPPERSLRLGHIAAASALTVYGDLAQLPDRERIRRLLHLDHDEWRAVRWTAHEPDR